MKRRMYLLLLLIYSNFLFAEPQTSNTQNPSVFSTSSQEVSTTLTDKKIASQKLTHTALASLQKLQKLRSISTEQTDNIKFDIKNANLTKGVTVTKGTSLVQISNAKVTSFTRKEENISDIAAAIYVITNDEIRRMGAKKLANVLRLAPGLSVVQAGANTWYIAVRGFNSATSNKLLVMIDGRSIYSTLYGGVLWQEQDYFLEDIDRIEIVRGPGGVVWGANAMNGVINIITKNSKNTQGTLLSGGGGNEIQVEEGRIGKQITKDIYARIYAKNTHVNAADNIAINDAGRMLQAGFRVDRLSAELGDIQFSGDIYDGGIGPTLNGLQQQITAQEYTGGNLLFNWNYNRTKEQNHQVLAYYDHTNLNAAGVLIDKRNTYNLGYQITQALNYQQVIAGLTYRRVNDDIPTAITQVIIPQRKIDQYYDSFIQDDISFLCDKAHFIIGTKYGVNDYTGSEWQPSIRGSYRFTPDNLLWAAWSRAVRIPTRLEEDIFSPPFFVGNTHLLAEVASVYEVGWRKKWDYVSLDLTAYTSKYQDLIISNVTSTENMMSGRVSGFEVYAGIQFLPTWLVRANYSYAISDLFVSRSSLNTTAAFYAENSYPKNMLKIASMWDINPCWQFNFFIRAVDQIQVQNVLPTNPQVVRGFVVADASVVWKQNKILNWQLVARNLGRSHYEWGGPTAMRFAPSIALYLTANLA